MLDFIKQQLFPYFYARKVNGFLDRRYRKISKYNVSIDKESDTLKLIENIEKEIAVQIERKNKLEDKAKSVLFIITLSITTITFLLSYSKDNSDEILSLILLSLSVIFFITAGIQAISTLNVRRFHIIQQVIAENGEYLTISEIKKDDKYLKDITKAKFLNDIITTKISNSIFSAFILIRNGLVLYLSFFISIIFSNY